MDKQTKMGMGREGGWREYQSRFVCTLPAARQTLHTPNLRSLRRPPALFFLLGWRIVSTGPPMATGSKNNPLCRRIRK